MNGANKTNGTNGSNSSNVTVNRTTTTATTTVGWLPATSSAVCSPWAKDCKRCYATGCKLCEVGPELSYWDLRGTGRENTAKGEHDWACILPDMKCETLRYMRPNTHFTADVPYYECDAKFSSTNPPPAVTLKPRSVQTLTRAPGKKDSWSGSPGEWGVAQWTILSVPLAVIFGSILFVYCYMRKRRARQLQRVYVAPQTVSTVKGMEPPIEWNLTGAGRITLQELQKISKAVAEAEQADGHSQGRVRRRLLSFGVSNNLEIEHLKTICTLMDRHPQVSVSIDCDWRFADDASLKVLVVLLRKRQRCTFCPAGGPGAGGLLQLPADTSPAVAEALVEAITTSVHPEVDAICFAHPGPAPTHSVKNSPVIALTPLRLSCQELVLRRCLMADLGTVAVCAFVRPWSARIQVMRLTECEIGDAGAVALARLLGPGLRELCLTDNAVADVGISEIAKVLPRCDNLERLLLDRNCIGNAGAASLGMHVPRSNVQELTLGSHLGGNPVGEEGVEALARALDDEMPRAAANRASRLGSLNLDGCLVGVRGAQALGMYLPRSIIMALGVSRGHVGDEGAEAIIRGLPRSCVSLDLSGNGLSDHSATAVAEAFYRIPQLAVSLANNHLTVGLRAILHEEHGSRLRL